MELVRQWLQTNPSPDKPLCLIIDIRIYPYLLSVSSFVSPEIGSCWVLPPRCGNSSWDAHCLINWILKWPCGDIDLHLMEHTRTHTLVQWEGETHTSFLPFASLTSSRLAYDGKVSRDLECFVVWNVSEVCDGWSSRVALSNAIKAEDTGRRGKRKKA